MKTKMISHALLFWFQLFGAFISAYAKNYIFMIWCTGWAVYSFRQIEKLVKQEQK